MAPCPQATGHCPTSLFHVDVSWHKFQASVGADFLGFLGLFTGSLYTYMVLKGGVSKGGGNCGTLRIPFGKIREP